ncbi:MAG: polyhydroxyalkanoate depolymerase, partial [Polaromonas sp.]|nr:polyhydroxyalkanoate depolymerase [Polaromonas sp.]
MLYAAYETQRVTLDGARAASRVALQSLDLLPPPLGDLDPVRRLRAAHQVFVDSAITHERLPFAIDKISVETPAGAQVVAVHEEVVARTPFCTLLRFAKDLPEGAPPQPRVLLVAPLSGHFATLLTDTVRTMLPDHDVHITDWHNARDVGLEHGPFGLDELVDHVVDFLPASMTLVAGPVDVELSPTSVNTLARSGPPDWFRDTVVTPVPPPYDGAGRLVYPGFMQLAGFVAMNPKRHVDAHLGLIEALVAGDEVQARSTREFYDEYLAVADLPAEVYLDTIAHIFQGNRLARGEYTWRGRRVHPERITRTGLLTIEGERDDICGPGQTMAAHDLCTRIPAYRRRHHLQAGVGHFGVFSGRRWAGQV